MPWCPLSTNIHVARVRLVQFPRSKRQSDAEDRPRMAVYRSVVSAHPPMLRR